MAEERGNRDGRKGKGRRGRRSASTRRPTAAATICQPTTPRNRRDPSDSSCACSLHCLLSHRYLLWCTEKYRLGWDPRVFKTIPKKPKKYRRYALSLFLYLSSPRPTRATTSRELTLSPSLSLPPRHGLAVQNGIRMRWSNKLDIGHAPRPWGMKAVVKLKRE